MYLKQRGVHSPNVVYNHLDAKRRVRAAIFMDEADCHDRAERQDEIYGETDGDQIWINPWCTGKEMALTLVHEALHDSVHVVRHTRQGKHKKLDLKQEHDGEVHHKNGNATDNRRSNLACVGKSWNRSHNKK